MGCWQDRCWRSGLALFRSGRFPQACLCLDLSPGCRHRPGSPAGLIRSLSAPGAGASARPQPCGALAGRRGFQRLPQGPALHVTTARRWLCTQPDLTPIPVVVLSPPRLAGLRRGYRPPIAAPPVWPPAGRRPWPGRSPARITVPASGDHPCLLRTGSADQETVIQRTPQAAAAGSTFRPRNRG